MRLRGPLLGASSVAPAPSAHLPPAAAPVPASSAPQGEGSSRPGVTARRCPPGPALHPSGRRVHRAERAHREALPAPGDPACAPGQLPGPGPRTGAERCSRGRPGGGASERACDRHVSPSSPTPSTGPSRHPGHRRPRTTRGRPAPPKRAARGRADHPTDTGARPGPPAPPAPPPSARRYLAALQRPSAVSEGRGEKDAGRGRAGASLGPGRGRLALPLCTARRRLRASKMDSGAEPRASNHFRFRCGRLFPAERT